MSLAPHRQLVLDGSKSRRAMPINNPPTAASFCPDGSGHHWIIDTPAGALSDGVCKKCGAERAFRTSSDENTSFNDDATYVRGLGKVVGW